MYVKTDNVTKIPYNMQINYDDTNYSRLLWIYQSDNCEKKVKNAAQVSPDCITKLLQPAIKVINDDVKKYPLTLEHFCTFISSTYGNSNTREIAKQYTNDLEILCNMLHDIHGLVQEKKIKARLTLILNRLRTTSSNVNNEDETLNDSSSSDEV